LPHLVSHVQPPLEFIPPALNPLVLRGAQLLLPFRLHRTSITNIQGKNVETLVNLYRQFQAGKIRFLIAFRHPSAKDPLCLAYLLWRMVPQEAQRQRAVVQHPIHAHFIYDRGIPLWAGTWVSWLYSRLGGTPIHRGKADRIGLRSARDLFANSSHPMAAAPEGATNGHSEIVSPLEPGIAQMGFWCVEDLRQAGRSEQVVIVPVGIQYRYVEAPWKALEKLLRQLESASGLPRDEAGNALPAIRAEEGTSNCETAYYQRLFRLGEHLLSVMEEFYVQFYHQPLSAASTPVFSSVVAAENAGQQGLSLSSPNQAFAVRLQSLLDVALRVAEQYFGLEPKGSVSDRCRRLEQAGWDYIYRADFKSIEALPPLQRGLANRIAAEASLRMWHMRLVESFVAVTGKYVQEKPTVERFAEITLLLWDMITRIKGESPLRRPQLGKQWVQMTVGQPIAVSDYWDTYQASHRSAKQAVADLTQELQTALERTIS